MRACSERALERSREEPDAVHPAAARGGDHRGQAAQDTQDHQLDQTGSQCIVIHYTRHTGSSTGSSR